MISLTICDSPALAGEGRGGGFYCRTIRDGGIPVSSAGSDRALCGRFRVVSGKLLIEIDGGQHNEAAGLSRDTVRTNWREVQGFQVMRFWKQ